jgi:hypothetical protein
MANLIQDIDAFCESYKISASQFGLSALNDKPFVHQVRNGRRVWPETEAKVRQFMSSYRASAKQDAAA